MLQQILPLTLSPVRGEVPAALARASGFWTKRPAPAPGGQHPKQPIVAVKDLRLPEGLSRIGCDTGQVRGIGPATTVAGKDGLFLLGSFPARLLHFPPRGGGGGGASR